MENFIMQDYQFHFQIMRVFMVLWFGFAEESFYGCFSFDDNLM